MGYERPTLAQLEAELQGGINPARAAEIENACTSWYSSQGLGTTNHPAFARVQRLGQRAGRQIAHPSRASRRVVAAERRANQVRRHTEGQSARASNRAAKNERVLNTEGEAAGAQVNPSYARKPGLGSRIRSGLSRLWRSGEAAPVGSRSVLCKSSQKMVRIDKFDDMIASADFDGVSTILDDLDALRPLEMPSSPVRTELIRIRGAAMARYKSQI
ncbi:MAG: hypothetical protein QF815_01930, partial [Candidatus Peribacteraceae bacterium]|nr:hypothetical protein [Candidatus Peribacteraceae bacterium]